MSQITDRAAEQPGDPIERMRADPRFISLGQTRARAELEQIKAAIEMEDRRRSQPGPIPYVRRKRVSFS